MPVDVERYPKTWKVFSQEIRVRRAQHRCECTGQCGLHQTTPGPRRCCEYNGIPGVFTSGRIVLTTAHLNAEGDICQCDPLCINPDHVLALCQRCHLRYDHARHMMNSRRTRESKRRQRSLGLGELDD